MRRCTAAAFAPEALRRASPKLGKNHAERTREHAEHAEKSWAFVLCSAVSAVNVFQFVDIAPTVFTRSLYGAIVP